MREYIEANIDVIKKVDGFVAQIPEVQSVVGKWGRVNSALDPAPISMFENTINYKPEYMVDENGHRLRFKTDMEGNYLLKNGGYLPINIGTGNGVSVLELIHAFEKASGQSIPWVFGPRRKGDAAEYYADPSLAKKTLGWSTKRNLDNMCLDMWHWQSKNPNGY